MSQPVAPTLVAALEGLLGVSSPVRIRAWDGSEAGAPQAPTVTLRSPRALRHLLWAPSELGLARAYVTGDIDVVGDLTAGLRRIWDSVTHGPGPRLRPSAAVPLLRAIGAALRAGALGPPPPPPGGQMRPRGRLHSRDRDAAVIAHHYDLSNTLYALLLDENMAYSCGYWTSDEPDYGLGDAQRDKLDLICRKLDLAPGSQLLDVGCGWGALAIHAAKFYGATVTGITLSTEQLSLAQGRVRAEGLSGQVDLSRCDYRDLSAGRTYDAITAIEMGEHVGRGNYPNFLRSLHGLLDKHGRLLIQQMSRAGRHPGGGAFIERYIAPDMHMRPLHETIGLVEGCGFEVEDVQSLREHYVLTIRAWLETFERRQAEVVAAVGTEQSRIWRLYLAGAALAFEANRMGVHQILATKARAAVGSATRLTRADWYPRSRTFLAG
ncbi:MAG: class I SAM-dependent methyltransferase [Mycobacteriales bacterium]